jgi:4-hydroxy-2-oxoheptanedioate aldolase
MLEGLSAIHNLDEILDVGGLDGLFVGPVDLSGELGHPGQPEHPEVAAAIKNIFDRCTQAGLATGVYAPTAKRANEWFGLGASLVAVSADSAMMLDGFRVVRDQVVPPAR